MHLHCFSVENYRSIATAQRLPTGERVTTLIGPNNEGKSNILRALVAVLQAIPQFGRRIPSSQERAQATDAFLKMPTRMMFRDSYNWDRDFPVTLQDEEEEKQSRFGVEFALTKRERTAFT